MHALRFGPRGTGIYSPMTLEYVATAMADEKGKGSLIMVALCNRADHYIFILFLSFFLSFFLFFHRLISAVGDWMLTILWQSLSAKLCGVEQRAPPMFGRATIRLGISPHSSFYFLFFPRLISAAADWMSTILLHMVWP